MKKLAFLLFGILACAASQAQDEPELIAEFAADADYFDFVMIANNTPKLAVYYAEYFDLFNLDYTLYTSVAHPAFVTAAGGIGSYVNFISLSMFDCDSTTLEYLVTSQTGNPDTEGAYVFREDGTQVFSLVGYRWYQSQNLNPDPNRKKVTADSSGTYLAFEGLSAPYQMRLYRFCGQLPHSSARGMNGSLLGGKPQGQNQEFKMYPNPATSHIRIDYDLQGHRHARAQIYSSSGTMVKEVRLGQGFSFFELDVSGLNAGTYVVRIITNDGAQLSQKFVKVGG